MSDSNHRIETNITTSKREEKKTHIIKTLVHLGSPELPSDVALLGLIGFPLVCLVTVGVLANSCGQLVNS